MKICTEKGFIVTTSSSTIQKFLTVFFSKLCGTRLGVVETLLLTVVFVQYALTSTVCIPLLS